MLLSTYHKTLVDFACPRRSHPSAKHTVINLRTLYANGQENLHAERVNVSKTKLENWEIPNVLLTVQL